MGSIPAIVLGSAPFRAFVFAIVAVIALASCGNDSERTVVDVASESRSHAVSECSAGFVAHELEHVTIGRGETISTFEATGAGVGIADLDGDDDLDIVLANLTGTPSILENVGSLTFERHELELGRFRGVSLVDVEGDSHVDIVLTTGIGPPLFYRNPGDGGFDGFERTRLDGVRAATYSMAWNDLNGDGDLDFVTGSYNAELTRLRNSPVLGDNTGVVLHTATDAGYEVTRLSEVAQALALVTTDIDGDSELDILVGNDLGTPDMIWLDSDDGWIEAPDAFTTSSYSTMSFDAADVDNDGRNELFSTDMRPQDPDDDRYRNVFEDLEAAPDVDDVQTPENVLNDPTDTLTFDNMAANEPISATGWSWSGLFGDLDNDGLQDLYIATGMQSEVLFDFLPDARLVEANQAFVNNGGNFTLIPDWGLNVDDDGRGMAMADIDADGDLDIVVNNLGSPAVLFENQLCGNAITVELEWSETRNLSALGATVRVEGGGQSWTRDITSSRGYLSSGPPVAHFGLGTTDEVDVEVTWPDGSVSTISDISAGRHLMVTR